MAETVLLESVNIEDEMKRSYLEYSMSVIVGRALPDIRDGLKPVHRRVLYGMYELKNFYNHPYKKSARIVGDVIGKYHPHGDAAVYDTIVRMAQDFSMRYPLVDGQGNFGSIDGDPPAAMRYTEVRMTRLAEEFMKDIEKDTVEFNPNYDGTLREPSILPTPIPNLLINGSSGIAVGMATNIPPHNLKEVCRAVISLIDNPSIDVEELMEVVKGPDFPTAGFIMGREGILEAYRNGRGLIKLRARAFVESPKRGRKRIVITEIPYQVNKRKLIERIAELIRDKKIEDVREIRDETDRDGLRVVLELTSEANPHVILNRLYKYSQLEVSFGIIFLAIVNGRPKVLGLKEILTEFIEHRKDIIRRRTEFDLRKAEGRAHILEGFKKALERLDEVIELIRSSTDPKEAKLRLMEELEITDIQAQAILDLRLQRLTALERDKIEREYLEILKDINRFKEILSNPHLVLQIIKDETKEIMDRYGDERRTEIIDKEEVIKIEDIIEQEQMVVTISHHGYIKRNPISLYRAQRRGGKGIIGAKTVNEDFIELLFVASTHDIFLFFTNQGRMYTKKVYEIPEAGRTSKGKAIINLLNLRQGEKIATTLAIKDFKEPRYVVMATKKGIVKRMEISLLSSQNSKGIVAIHINEGDELIGVKSTDGTYDIFLTTKWGKSIRFRESEIRTMGRNASGNIGIRMEGDDEVVGVEVLQEGATILIVTENGYGKRTKTEQYRVQARGGKGIITHKVTERNGPVVYAYQVEDTDRLMLITNRGKIIMIKASDIPITGRNTQGVRLINLEQGERVVGVAKVVEEE